MPESQQRDSPMTSLQPLSIALAQQALVSNHTVFTAKIFDDPRERAYKTPAASPISITPSHAQDVDSTITFLPF